MNKITAFLAALKLRLMDRFAPTIGDLLETFNKIETQIENAIQKDERQLDSMARAAIELQFACRAKNADLDRAYKLLHNVASMVR